VHCSGRRHSRIVIRDDADMIFGKRFSSHGRAPARTCGVRLHMCDGCCRCSDEKMWHLHNQAA